MSTQDFRSAIEDLRSVFEILEREMSARAAPLSSQLLNLLVSRVRRAIDEGMPILESECSRRMLVLPPRHTHWDDASLVHAIDRDMNREENTMLRWLLISYWVVLCDVDFLIANVEALVGDPDQLTWLVAGALWVQAASGQSTHYQVREALVRFRARHTGLDVQLAAVLAGPPSAAREAAEIAERLLADPSATLPTHVVWRVD